VWNDRQAIEVFHLLFLRALAARVDPAFFVLKGGCNLRFFCKSIRYSEDIDLDVRTVAVNTLKKHVETLLASPTFSNMLRAQQLAVESVSSAKQTGTTQRWKLQIRVNGSPQAMPSKIEFSRRQFNPDLMLEAVDAELINRYRLYAVFTQHYTPAVAFLHKVEALALRNQTQARDLFDLKLLLDMNARPLAGNELSRILPAAVENAIGIGYDDFAGQVLAYLEPEYQDRYRPRKVWETLQAEVVEALEALRQ
jgi:predicted nucleotidyltransferase component of viral defense system